MATDKVTTSVLTRVQKIAEEAQSRLEQKAAETPKQLFLPGMEDFTRAMPNSIARSSLFAPVAKGKRKHHDGTIIASRSDAEIRYYGYQLDEADADIMLQLMFESRHSPLGEPVEFTRAAFLRSLGRTLCKNNYDWLERRMDYLTFAGIKVKVYKPDGKTKYEVGFKRTFHMLSSFDINEETGIYTFTIDPRWATLFGNREYALVDWIKRLAITQGQDMAKSLQRLLATSADTTQRYSLNWLKEKLQYSGRLRDFKQAIDRSVIELKRVGIIIEGKIEINSRKEEQLTVQILK